MTRPPVAPPAYALRIEPAALAVLLGLDCAPAGRLLAELGGHAGDPLRHSAPAGPRSTRARAADVGGGRRVVFVIDNARQQIVVREIGPPAPAGPEAVAGA